LLILVVFVLARGGSCHGIELGILVVFFFVEAGLLKMKIEIGLVMVFLRFILVVCFFLFVSMCFDFVM